MIAAQPALPQHGAQQEMCAVPRCRHTEEAEQTCLSLNLLLMQCYRGMPINRINGQYFTSDTIQDQDARSKANISQLNIPHRTNKEKVGKKKNKKVKTIIPEVSLNSPGNSWSQS